ncbi:unnamed protein product [Arabis nemorensis]|uniref:DUF1985 domain-containing protein n=1 Tax=Arabis nemorensis TaxID=586526 RepID=A0A565C954_9BRAS|nr:unnamed protein product [Arabis nemorensis]
MLSLQLDTAKPYEIWSLIDVKPVTDEMKAFWELLEVNLEMGPSINDLVAACGACDSWSRVDRIRLGYLCIYAGYIEGRRESTPTPDKMARLIMDLDAFVNYSWGRVAFKNLLKSIKEKDLTKSSYVVEGFVQVLQVWVYWALPDFAKEFGELAPNSPTPLLLAFKGSRGQNFFKENMLRLTNVRNFVVKNTVVEMVPFWDGDVADAKVANIVSVSFDKGWKWKNCHWPVVGVNFVTNRNEGSCTKYNNRSHGESRKRTRSGEEDPVSLIGNLQKHIDDCFTDLSR